MNDRKYKLYVFHAEKYCKIGYAQSVEDRLHTIQTGCPLLISEYWKSNDMNIKDVQLTESNMHLYFQDNLQIGEWYQINYKQAVSKAQELCKFRGCTTKIKEVAFKKYRSVIRMIDADFPKTIFVDISTVEQLTGLSENTIIRMLDISDCGNDLLYIIDNEKVKVHRNALVSLFWSYNNGRVSKGKIKGATT